MIIIKEINVKKILTKSKLPDADYVINPYIGCPHKCIYCYAEFMKRFTNHNESWGSFIDIKKCSKKISTKSLANKTILLSSVTDAYNPFEAKYMITRSILNQLIGSEAKIEILTKSKLVLRDLDLLKEIKNLSIGISLNTLDDNFRKQTEPLASSVEDRLEVLKVLKYHGIKSYLFISPIFPEITDINTIIDKVENIVDLYCFENLNLREPYKNRVLRFISEHSPEFYSLYSDIYLKGKIEYWDRLEAEIIRIFTNNRLNYKIYFHHGRVK